MYSGKHILIACGGRPTVPAFPGKKYFILNSKNSDKWIGDLDKV